MDSILDSFFDNFNGEIENHRLDRIRKDALLKDLSKILKDRLEASGFLKMGEARRFQNPYLYYRLDIKSTTSVGNIVDELLDTIDCIYSKLTVDDSSGVSYITFNPFNLIKSSGVDDYLLTKIISAKYGTVAIELMIISDSSVITYDEAEEDYNTIYFIDEEIQEGTFSHMADNKYNYEDLIFIPNINSNSPFDSTIYREQ